MRQERFHGMVMCFQVVSGDIPDTRVVEPYTCDRGAATHTHRKKNLTYHPEGVNLFCSGISLAGFEEGSWTHVA